MFLWECKRQLFLDFFLLWNKEHCSWVYVFNKSEFNWEKHKKKESCVEDVNSGQQRESAENFAKNCKA